MCLFLITSGYSSERSACTPTENMKRPPRTNTHTHLVQVCYKCTDVNPAVSTDTPSITSGLSDICCLSKSGSCLVVTPVIAWITWWRTESLHMFIREIHVDQYSKPDRNLRWASVCHSLTLAPFLRSGSGNLRGRKWHGLCLYVALRPVCFGLIWIALLVLFHSTVSRWCSPWFFFTRVSPSGETLQFSVFLTHCCRWFREFFSCEVIVWTGSGINLCLCAQ